MVSHINLRLGSLRSVVNERLSGTGRKQNKTQNISPFPNFSTFCCSKYRDNLCAIIWMWPIHERNPHPPKRPPHESALGPDHHGRNMAHPSSPAPQPTHPPPPPIAPTATRPPPSPPHTPPPTAPPPPPRAARRPPPRRRRTRSRTWRTPSTPHACPRRRRSGAASTPRAPGRRPPARRPAATGRPGCGG